jgi:predicted GNAT family acetyltransferase
MAIHAWSTDSPGEVLERAGGFLAGDPVRHNVILTLLQARVARAEPGRYWVVERDGNAAGVVFRSPMHYMATITPMAPEVVHAAVDAVLTDRVLLPGVTGEAATAAAFAGHWTERARTGARPLQGQRIYEVDAVVEPAPTKGLLRAARADEQPLLVEWFQAFQADIGEAVSDATAIVGRRLARGELWIWDDDGPASMAGRFDAVEGVARIGPVYTPGDRRGHGYASALVAAVSRAVLEAGHRCILYTDLENPTSNSIYRAIGYRAVAEALRYRFDDQP